jgi:hypothetical protein
MFKLLLPTFIYLYYSFFLTYAAITSASACISFVYDYAISCLRVVTSVFFNNWSGSDYYGGFVGLPWLGRATPTPIMPSFSAFSFAFVFGVLAIQLCWDLF